MELPRLNVHVGTLGQESTEVHTWRFGIHIRHSWGDGSSGCVPR